MSKILGLSLAFNKIFVSAAHADDLKHRLYDVVGLLDADEVIYLDYLVSRYFEEQLGDDVIRAFRSQKFRIEGEL